MNIPPPHQVVCRMKRMGGGFGGKETRSVFISCAAALAAHLTQRPVRVTLDRDVDMLITGQRHAFVATYVTLCRTAACLPGGGDGEDRANAWWRISPCCVPVVCREKELRGSSIDQSPPSRFSVSFLPFYCLSVVTITMTHGFGCICVRKNDAGTRPPPRPTESSWRWTRSSSTTAASGDTKLHFPWKKDHVTQFFAPSPASNPSTRQDDPKKNDTPPPIFLPSNPQTPPLPTTHSLDLSGPVADRALFHLDNCYKWPSLRARGRIVRTHQASHTAFRGFGGPQVGRQSVFYQSINQSINGCVLGASR